MDVRRLARGSIDWDLLEGIAIEVLERRGRSAGRVSFVETNNWSSIPFVLDDDVFVKVVTPHHALVHALFTGARNLGAMSSGAQGFFDRFDGPLEMARHEVRAIERIRAIGLNAPRPIEAFAHGGVAVVVMEFLPSLEPLGSIDLANRPDLPESLFASLAVMHRADVAHGDLRSDNVLVVDGALHFIDATLVSEGQAAEAAGYDLACAIAITAPALGAKRAVALANRHFSGEELLAARRFLDFVRLRPDHDFDVVQVRGEIESLVA